MANALLQDLSAAAALSGSDLFYVKQGGARGLKATGTQLLTLVGTAYLPLAGGTMTGALTIASGTLTASAPALSITQTWTTGATFTASLINITDTSSNSNSLLQDWQIGGSTVARVRKDGTLFLSGGLSSGGSGFFSTIVLGGAADLYLYRDAAATLAQRDGTNAQTLRVYRSYTDASNYSRLAATWNTSTALLMAEGLGTGTDGNVAFNDAALATGATLGYIMVPSAAGISTGVPADIPTGQTPIVFDSTNKKIGAYTGGAWVWTAALS